MQIGTPAKEIGLSVDTETFRSPEIEAWGECSSVPLQETDTREIHSLPDFERERETRES